MTGPINPDVLTYMIEHNPNCPSPFLVRLPDGILDKRPTYETSDFFGYGETFEDALEHAVAMKNARAWERENS